MKPACPKLSSPVYPKCTLSPIAARQYTAATGPRPCWRAWLKIECQSIPVLLTDPLGLAEQTLRPDQQDDDQHDQRADELELGRHEEGRDLDEHPDDQCAHDRAPGGAEPTQHRGGEHQQQDLEAQLEVEA